MLKAPDDWKTHTHTKKKLILLKYCLTFCILTSRSLVWLKKTPITLTLSQTTNFRVFQTQNACRLQFQTRLKWQKVLQTGRKQCGKRKNCSLRAISPFPTVFKKTCSADM